MLVLRPREEANRDRGHRVTEQLALVEVHPCTTCDGQGRGVTGAAIEEPFGAGVAKGTMPLLVVMGAIVACLPRGITLALLRSDDWRRECGLPLRVPREQHKRNSVAFALEHWTDAGRVD